MGSSAKAGERAWLWICAGGLCLGLATGFYVWFLPANDVEKLNERGDAMAPFAALFSAGALGAALWSVHLQRHELEEQRKMLQAQLDEMQGTREVQAKQEAAQNRLAQAQEVANALSQEMVVAQQAMTLATLKSALFTLISSGKTVGHAGGAAETRKRDQRDLDRLYSQIRKLEKKCPNEPTQRY